MCLYPKLIINKKYISNEKNKGIVPIMKDERVKYVPVGCGYCIECMRKKSRDWQVRLYEEVKNNKMKGYFVTLTFSNESIFKLNEQLKLKGIKKVSNLENEIATLAVRLFLERWRKKFKVSVRHWFVTELGHEGTERIHLHGIIWTNEDKEFIDNIWGYGFTWIGEYLNFKTINYVTKYITKVDLKNKGYTPKILTSAGIGKGYVKGVNFKNSVFNDDLTKDYYVNSQGYKMSLPIYYRNKRYNDDEREILWLSLLDKNERFILGTKIDADDLDYYDNVLASARAKNKRLGYGDDETKKDFIYKNKLKQLSLLNKYARNRK